MKKEFNIINTYINTATKEIKDKKIKRELKEELFSHLIEIYERNIALGMSNETAQKDAVEHMGNSEAVAQTFKKLYPISAYKFFKSSTCVLVYSFIHYFITIWGCNTPISEVQNSRFFLVFAIQIVVFWCFCKINKYFKATFITTIINYLCILGYSTVNNYFVIEYDIKYIIVFSFILDALRYIFFFKGIQQIEKDIEIEEKASLSPRGATVLMIITHAIVVASVFIDFEISFVLLLLAVFTGIYPISLIGSSYDLFNRIEVDIYKTVRSRRKVIISVVAFCLIAFTVTSVIPLKHPELKDFNKSTINMSEKAQKIRENIISLGLPETIANDLPDDEIMLYGNAKKMEADTKDDEYVTLRNRAYAFYIYDDKENLDYVRILICLDEFDNYEKFYRDGIYVYMPDENEFDYFTHILCEYDGKTKSIVPIYNNLTDIDKAVGCEFTLPKNSENERIYISASIDAVTDISGFGLWCSYYHGTRTDAYRTYQLANTMSGKEVIRTSFDNPIYIEPEMPTIVFPYSDDETTTDEIEEIDNIDDLIEYWNP